MSTTVTEQLGDAEFARLTEPLRAELLGLDQL